MPARVAFVHDGWLPAQKNSSRRKARCYACESVCLMSSRMMLCPDSFRHFTNMRSQNCSKMGANEEYYLDVCLELGAPYQIFRLIARSPLERR